MRTVLLGCKCTIVSPQGINDEGQGQATVTVSTVTVEPSVSGVQGAEALRYHKT